MRPFYYLYVPLSSSKREQHKNSINTYTDLKKNDMKRGHIYKYIHGPKKNYIERDISINIYTDLRKIKWKWDIFINYIYGPQKN